ncbi:MAG TPA: hypothetical protein VE197_08735 [Mycobacterium sp.]|nr:hypothetical protein [Mycobacterium sp.]
MWGRSSPNCAGKARVVAVDADTAFGRLGSRIDPRASGSYWDLAADNNGAGVSAANAYVR